MTRKYKLLRGMTLPMLETAINDALAEDPSSQLVQAFFAQGTGFVAAMEYEEKEEKQKTPPAKPPAPEPSAAKQPPAAGKASTKSSKS